MLAWHSSLPHSRWMHRRRRCSRPPPFNEGKGMAAEAATKPADDYIGSLQDRIELSCVDETEMSPGVRIAVEEHLQEYAPSHDVGCATLIVPAGYHLALATAEPMAAFSLTSREWAALADALSIKLVLENMHVPPAPAEVEHPSRTAGEVEYILDAADSPRLNRCLDLGHPLPLPLRDYTGGTAIEPSNRDQHVQGVDHLDRLFGGEGG